MLGKDIESCHVLMWCCSTDVLGIFLRLDMVARQYGYGGVVRTCELAICRQLQVTPHQYPALIGQ